MHLPDVMSNARTWLRVPLRMVRATVENLKDALARLGMFNTALPRGHQTTAGALGKRILIVDDLVPDPRFGAGYPRAFAIVEAMVKAGHRVSIYPMASTRGDIARLSNAFTGRVSFYAGEGPRGLRRLLWSQGETFDILFISRPAPMQAFVDSCWRPRKGAVLPPVIYDAEAVLTPREARRRNLFGPAWSDADYKNGLEAELGLARSANTVTAVSQQDAKVIGSVLTVPVFVLPHPVTVKPDVPDFADRKDLLFVGRLTGTASQSPNVDSILWFLGEVVPILDNILSKNYTLHIVGIVDCVELSTITSDRVVFHGVVDDLDPLYDMSRVFIAPTRYAAGIPLKVIEAMGRGIPCVATPLLAEQLATTDHELPTGMTPHEFALQCARLYTDPVAWRNCSTAGLDHVGRLYSHEAFDRTLTQVLDRIDHPRTVP